MDVNKIIPINVDRNVSPKEFTELAEAGKLLVTSTFYTFQGEGPFAGQPAVFIRLAGCNIGAKEDCPFCDTYFNLSTAMATTVDMLIEEIARLWPGGYGSGRAPLVVITGGEPLLQWPMIEKLINAGRQECAGIQWQIETNGMYLREEHLDFVPSSPSHPRNIFDTMSVAFVVSPKIPHGKDRYSMNAIRPEWFDQDRADKLYLKFVVTADTDNPYCRLPLHLLLACGVEPESVYISGMTDYTDTVPTMPDAPVNMLWSFSERARVLTGANWAYAAQLALQHGVNVSFQTHLLAGVQ